jgi:hypothetical protein
MPILRTLSAALVVLGSFLTCLRAHAQAAGADCGPPILPQLCVDFDASRSVDSAAGPLVYRWQMGDSTTLTGLSVSHCYKRRARYRVVLDVLVPATGEVRPAEKTFEVDLLAQPVIYFRDFRDGTTQQGQRIAHTFRKAGRYQVRLSLRGYGPGDCASSHCATQEVVVEP